MTYEHLIFEKDGPIAKATLNQPEKLNALSSEMRRSLAQAIEEVSDDPSIRVFVLTGAGRGFCSGADLSAGPSKNAADIGLGERHRLDPIGWLSIRLNQLNKPTIAAINGVAVGAGLGLSLSCDIRVASEDARFASIFIRRGLVPDNGVTFLLPKAVGVEKACEMAYTGVVIDAQEALRIGLVGRVVAADQLMSVVYELAGRIAKMPPITIGLTKKAIYRGLNSDLHGALEFESYGQGVVRNTEDAAEGRRAFLEKREPVFKGR